MTEQVSKDAVMYMLMSMAGYSEAMAEKTASEIVEVQGKHNCSFKEALEILSSEPKELSAQEKKEV